MAALTDEQRAAVEEYAGYPHALAFSRRVYLRYHDRLDLRQWLCLRLIRVVQTYRGDNPHAAIVHRLRLYRRQWLCAPARRRRAADVAACWSEAEGGRLPPAAPAPDLDDRDEFRVMVLERLHLLAPRHRQAVELYLAGYPWCEVAELMGIARTSVERLRREAVERLRLSVLPARPG